MRSAALRIAAWFSGVAQISSLTRPAARFRARTAATRVASDSAIKAARAAKGGKTARVRGAMLAHFGVMQRQFGGVHDVDDSEVRGISGDVSRKSLNGGAMRFDCGCVLGLQGLKRVHVVFLVSVPLNCLTVV